MARVSIGTELSEDITPQLGGDLDANDKNITGVRSLNAVCNDDSVVCNNDEIVFN